MVIQGQRKGNENLHPLYIFIIKKCHGDYNLYVCLNIYSPILLQLVL